MSGTTKQDSEWGYCGKCGRELQLVRERTLGKFSHDDGHEYVEKRIECPSKRWAFDGHWGSTINDVPYGYK